MSLDVLRIKNSTSSQMTYKAERNPASKVNKEVWYKIGYYEQNVTVIGQSQLCFFWGFSIFNR